MTKNDYKDFALVGSLPFGWNMQPLKYFLLRHDGGSWGEEAKGSFGDCICIRIADFDYSKGTVRADTDKLTVRYYTNDVIERLSLQVGDIIVEKSGGGDKTPVGRTIVFRQDYKALFANFCERLRIKNDYNFEFVNYCLMAFYSIGGSYNYFNQTTGIQNLSIGKWLNDIYLPCPNRSMQDTIVEYLDAKCAAIDEAIERHKKIIEKLEEYQFSKISSQISNLPLIKIGRFLTSIQTGPFGSQLHSEEYVEGGVAVINPSNIQKGNIFVDNQCTITQEKAEELSRHRLMQGDIVIARRGEMGRCAVVKNDGMICGTGCFVIKCGKKILPEYASICIRSNRSVEYLTMNAIGTTMANLNTDIIASCPIPYCDVSMQEKILAVIADITQNYQLAISKHNNIITRLEEYRKSIIYNAITGKIDCREEIK